MKSEAIVDQIYEAAFVPDSWEAVLETTSRLSDSVGGAIFSFSQGAPLRGRTVEQLKPLLSDFIADDMWKLCDSVSRMNDIRPASFVTIDDFLSAEEIEHDPIRVRLRAMGIGCGLCSVIPLPSGDTVSFVYPRALARGSYKQAEIGVLDELRPHLGRAALVASQLGLEQARNAVSLMEKLGLPSAVLTAGGRVIATNALLDGLPGIFMARAHGALALPTSKADALLQAAFAELRSGHAATRSIPVPPDADRPPIIVHVLPLRRTARDIFPSGDVLIAATEMRPGTQEPPASVLMGLFDLTPAEAQLALALTRGRTLQEAAMQQGIRIKTARTYLAQIFRKTGTGQQSQLVALLAAARPLRPE